MRSLGVFFPAAACAVWLGSTCVFAQSGVGFGPSEDQLPPYHTHEDRRHGHDHVYPDRGAIVRDLPRGATTVNYAGISYRFDGGVWFEPRGPAYVVVAPPIGLIVPALPGYATVVHDDGKSYLYANDVYYRARPDLGGYEVVNDPRDTPPAVARVHAVAPEGAAAAPESAKAAPGLAKAPALGNAAGSLKAADSLKAPDSLKAADSLGTLDSPKVSVLPAATVHASPPPAPPPTSTPSSSSGTTRLSVVAENGQSPDRQARDRYDCYRFAVGQSGFDPLAVQGKAGSAGVTRRRSEYERAQAACLEERGYRLR